MSWESTSVYYRLLNEGVRARLGGHHSAPLVLWSFDFAKMEALQASGDWGAATGLMIEAARAVEGAGAELLLIGTNTMHKMAREVQDAISIPLLHIADATGQAISIAGVQRPLLLATRYTMEQDFYKGRLQDTYEIDVLIPDEEDRGEVHRIIYEELCQGRIGAKSKSNFLEVIAKARKEGADGVILGCTEIGLLIGPSDLDLPAFDTTIIHTTAALDLALDLVLG